MAPAEVDAIAIVLLGRFNPPIFHPSWLGAQQLISPAEAEAAKVVAILPDVAAFEVGGWLAVEVRNDRFQALASFARAMPLRDFAVNLLTLLEHTPVQRLGINRHMHFRLASQEQRDTLGRILAPPSAWPAMLAAPALRSIGMEGKRGSSPSKYSIMVEPSALLTPMGVFFGSNEEYACEAGVPGATRAAQLLGEQFEESIKFALDLAEATIQQVVKTT